MRVGQVYIVYLKGRACKEVGTYRGDDDMGRELFDHEYELEGLHVSGSQYVPTRPHERSFSIPSNRIASVEKLPPGQCLRRSYQKGDEVFWFSKDGASEYFGWHVRFNWGTFDQHANNGSCYVEHPNSILATYVPKVEHLFVQGYQELHRRCRAAIFFWMLCTSKLGVGPYKQRVPKDIRRLIGKLVWQTRDDREWEHRHSKPARSSHKKIKSYAE